MAMLKRYLTCAMALAVLATGARCAMDVPPRGYDYLTPPIITSLEQRTVQDGSDTILEIEVRFIGYNNEYYFDGYNVYVSPNSMNRDLIESYRPVPIGEHGYSMATPSYPLGPDDYDPKVERRMTLRYYAMANDDVYTLYAFGPYTYYVMLCSHHREGLVYPESVSNQVAILLQ